MVGTPLRQLLQVALVGIPAQDVRRVEDHRVREGVHPVEEPAARVVVPGGADHHRRVVRGPQLRVVPDPQVELGPRSRRAGTSRPNSPARRGLPAAAGAGDMSAEVR